jgi:hypothetical protein
MYYYLFINNYYDSISNILLLEETYTKTQTINIIIFLFNSSKIENLLDKNEVKIVMSFKNLKEYREVLIDDKYIVDFLKNENSMTFIKQSLFGNKYNDTKFKKKYNILLEFLNYLNTNNYTNIIFTSGVVYLLYGLRVNDDIDLFMTHNYKIKFNKIEIDSFYVTPTHIKNIPIYNNLFNNLNNTFYFKGFRILTVHADINAIKKTRAMNKNFKYPKAVANIIMAKKLIDQSINIPIDLTTLNTNKQSRVLKKIKWMYSTDYNPFTELKK